MANVDFCEQMVKDTNPALLAKAEQTSSPHGDIHGYKTIADIMRALNPFTGSFYLETLQVGAVHAGDCTACSAGATPTRRRSCRALAALTSRTRR